MIRFCFALVATVLLIACDEETPSVTAQTSADGTNYTLIHLPGQEDVSIHIAWATDWAYTSGANQAVPYIGVDLILAGGAEGFPAGEVGERFADIDAEGYLTATVDHILGQLSFPAEHIDEVVEVARAHLQTPTMDEMWFDRISNGFSQNITEAISQPRERSFAAVRWAVLGDHPLRNALSLDAPGMFDGLTRDDIVAWHGETIVANPEQIVIAGDLDATTAGQAIDALLTGLPVKEAQAVPEVPLDYTPRRILLHVPGAQVTNLAFVGPLPPTRLGDEWEDIILTEALGGGDQSVLFEAVRTGLRATYGYGAGYSNYSREARIFVMTGEIETEKLTEAETVIREAYADFRDVGPSGDLADRTSPIAANLADLPGFVADQAYSELQSLLDGYAPGRSLQMIEELDAVTDETVLNRLQTGFPAISDFIMIAVSADPDALPGACVITTPQEAMDC